ncbi:Homoserine dehydrogenase [Mycobacterium talmoniae]|uniref:Homoserine dehydrogenase n=1 Tax=Mycobacterium talmoniae TaxID=1858794 RepID=A0A2S8BLE4_9MYCO|nr:Homoserine dehydrogenase [Mycobacterium talmoniae]
MLNEEPVGVAVLGLGNVGSEVVRIIEDSADDLAARIGAPLVLRGVGVRRVAADRGVPAELLTDNIEELVSRDDVDIVVELMGPVEPARKAILLALEHGKSVVTANKALLSRSTGELADAAERARVDLYFEAAVAGAIPVIRPLTQSLAGDTVRRVAGIVNGTTNYILSEMDSTGTDYASALADARALGYAEADPTADVEASTPRPRPPSWRPSPFIPESPPTTSIARASATSPRTTWRPRVPWAAPSNCCRSASGSPPPKASNGFRLGSTRPWCRRVIRWPPSTVRSTPWWWRPRPPVG